MNIRTLLAQAILCGLAACATPYQERGMMGGFTESQLGPRVWRVNFVSNPGRTPDEVKDMILLRSAELVTAGGFDRFVVVQASDQKLVTGVVGVSTFSGGIFASLFTPMRNPDISAVIEARPRSSPREVEYDATFLLRSLGPKYGLRRSTIERSATAPPLEVKPVSATPAVIAEPAAPAVAKKPPAIIGQDSVGAERLARDVGCVRDVLANLIAKGPGYETYSFQCVNGDTLLVRCDFGNCRALK
jgi:hypothetical protein